MTKMSTRQEDLVVLKSVCTKQQNYKTCEAKAGELKGEIGNFTVTIGDFNAPL